MPSIRFCTRPWLIGILMASQSLTIHVSCYTLSNWEKKSMLT